MGRMKEHYHDYICGDMELADQQRRDADMEEMLLMLSIDEVAEACAKDDRMHRYFLERFEYYARNRS